MPEPARAPRTRRRLALLLFFVSIGLLGFYVLDRFVGDLEPYVETRLAREIGRPVHVEGLHYRPFFGGSFSRVAVEEVGEARDVSLDLSGSSLIRGRFFLDRLDVDSVVLDLRRDSAGRWNLEGLFPNADTNAPPSLRAVSIRDIAVLVAGETEPLVSYRGRIDATIDETGAYRASLAGRIEGGGASLRVAGLAEIRKGGGGPEGTADLDVSSESPALAWRGRVTMETGEFRAEGILAPATLHFGRAVVEGLAGDLKARVVRDAAGARLAVAWGRLRADAIDLGGVRLHTRGCDFSVVPRGAAYDLDVRGEVEAEKLGEVLALAFVGSFNAPADLVVERLALEGKDGAVEARGRISSAAAALTLEAKRVSLGRLVSLAASYAGESPPAFSTEGLLEGTFEVAGKAGAIGIARADWRIPRARFASETYQIEIEGSAYRLRSEGGEKRLETNGRIRGRYAAYDIKPWISFASDGPLPEGSTFRFDRLTLEGMGLEVQASYGLVSPETIVIDMAARPAPVDRLLAEFRTAGLLHEELRGGGEIQLREARIRRKADGALTAEGAIRFRNASLRIPERPFVFAEGLSGEMPFWVRPRREGERIATRAEEGIAGSSIHIARVGLAQGIEARDVRFTSAFAGRELKIETGSFELARGRGEIAGLVSFREGGPVRTAFLGRLRGFRFEDLNESHVFEGELAGPADARLHFAMEGDEFSQFHAEIRSTGKGRIGPRFLREIAEKLDRSTTRTALLGLSKFDYQIFSADLDLIRNYYDRETARGYFKNPARRDTIRHEILMNVGFEGPMNIWGPLHIDVDCRVQGMPLFLLFDRMENRPPPSPEAPPPTGGPPPPA